MIKLVYKGGRRKMIRIEEEKIDSSIIIHEGKFFAALVGHGVKIFKEIRPPVEVTVLEEMTVEN